MSFVSSLINPVSSFRSFLERLQYRDKAKPAPITLHRRRIYIVPTRSGFVYALVMFSMLIGAINYSSSLIFLLTFLLTAVGFTSMVHTFQNLHRLVLLTGHTKSVFCGNTLYFPLIIENPSKRTRRSIILYNHHEAIHGIDIEALSNKTVFIPQPTTQRGISGLERFTLQTTYPLGLFRAWSPVFIDNSAVVYPVPALPGKAPPIASGRQGTRIQRGLGDDDYIGIREYQKGDSLRDIDWKAMARGLPLMTKEYGAAVSEDLWFNWNALPNLDDEARLSQITRWIIDAERRGDSFGIDIPGFTLSPSHGETHRHQALHALALFGLRGHSS